jgi:ribosomal 30S subunit maturation factor RimM
MAAEFHFPEDYILVGKIAGPHGLKGDFKLHCFSDSTETLLEYPRVLS